LHRAPAQPGQEQSRRHFRLYRKLIGL
jgi:hypothetical protein